MKKALALFLFVSMILLCIACTASNQAPDAKTELAIKQSFLETYEKTETTEQLSLRHLGCYGGAYAVYVDGPYGYMTVMRSEKIGGLTFTFSSSQKLYVYKDGQITTLSQAYANGWLTDDGLSKLHSSYFG